MLALVGGWWSAGSAYAVAPVPGFQRDVNGDGLNDVVTSAEGAAHVFFGRRPDGAGTGDRVVSPDFTITGLYSRPEYSIVGDLNGDRLADIVIADPAAEPYGRESSGALYVVFGARQPVSVDVGEFGSRSLRIAGPPYADREGPSVWAGYGGVGDFTADGLSDLVASVHVLLGTRSRRDIDLASAPSTAIEIRGASAFFEAAAAGDVNRDGYDDILAADPFGGRCGLDQCEGRAWLIYGRRRSPDIRLSRLGGQGTRLCLRRRSLVNLYGPDGVGDVDGDGRPDLALRGQHVDDPYGPATTEIILSPVRSGCGGRGRHASRRISIAGFQDPGPAGDISGDGRADLVAVPDSNSRNAPPESGAYLLYGRARERSVSGRQLRRRDGFRLVRTSRPGEVIEAIEGVGDTNGDRRGDFTVDTNQHTYTVFGHASRRTLDLAALGASGYLIR